MSPVAAAGRWARRPDPPGRGLRVGDAASWLDRRRTFLPRTAFSSRPLGSLPSHLEDIAVLDHEVRSRRRRRVPPSP